MRVPRDNPLPEDARSDQRFCDRTCKGSARRQRRRRERAKAVLSNFPGLSAPLSQSSELREADARFRAMLVADEASRTPQTQEREWAAWERRHPGTAHPDRVRARIARGQQARQDDWNQGTARFLRTPSSVAELGRAQRARQGRPMGPPMQAGPPSYEDDDPVQPAEMIDLGDWRRGRKW